VIILLLAISGYLLMVIGDYSINGYWRLFYYWLLVVIYYWLLVTILLLAIGGYLLMAIGGYYINGY